MSQRSAAWNLASLLLPAVGLVFVFLGPAAHSTPVQFFYFSAAVYSVGLCLLVAAKASLFRQARYVSWGSEHMTVWNRRAYRAGYVLIMCGIVAAAVFAIVWRSP
jgi:formate/nitrite transporter FocA (FNT family)